MVMPGTLCWRPSLGKEFGEWWPYIILQGSSEDFEDVCCAQIDFWVVWNIIIADTGNN